MMTKSKFLLVLLVMALLIGTLAESGSTTESKADKQDRVGEQVYKGEYDEPGCQATECFGNKVLSLHLPSAWQVHDEEQIVKDTRGLIVAAKNPTRLIVGITEDMAFDKYVPIVQGILKGVKKYGRISLK